MLEAAVREVQSELAAGVLHGEGVRYSHRRARAAHIALRAKDGNVACPSSGRKQKKSRNDESAMKTMRRTAN